jgi:solute carrier family 66 (lysosomal lysine-arginine transporter), member 1
VSWIASLLNAGLSLLFFLLSLMGNLTYGVGILCHSVEKEYIATTLPWLIGSLGTMIEDGIIFLQFRIYAPKPSSSAIE